MTEEELEYLRRQYFFNNPITPRVLRPQESPKDVPYNPSTLNQRARQYQKEEVFGKDDWQGGLRNMMEFGAGGLITKFPKLLGLLKTPTGRSERIPFDQMWSGMKTKYPPKTPPKTPYLSPKAMLEAERREKARLRLLEMLEEMNKTRR